MTVHVQRRTIPPVANPRPPRIAVVNETGGAGKTTLAISVAVWWVTAYRQPAALLDTDHTRGVAVAADILARTDTAVSLPKLTYATSTADRLAVLLDRVADRMVVIDTPPLINTAAVRRVAGLADLVLIPGSTSETRSIVATARRLPGVTCAAVITKTTTTTLRGQLGATRMDDLNRVLPIAGIIRRNQGLADSYDLGQRPDQMPGPYWRRWAEDMDLLFGRLTRFIPIPTPPQGV